MQDWFNNQKSNSEIQHISKIKKKIYMILSIDGAKFKYIHDRKKKRPINKLEVERSSSNLTKIIDRKQ